MIFIYIYRKKVYYDKIWSSLLSNYFFNNFLKALTNPRTQGWWPRKSSALSKGKWQGNEVRDFWKNLIQIFRRTIFKNTDRLLEWSQLFTHFDRCSSNSTHYFCMILFIKKRDNPSFPHHFLPLIYQCRLIYLLYEIRSWNNMWS